MEAAIGGQLLKAVEEASLEEVSLQFDEIPTRRWKSLRMRQELCLELQKLQKKSN